MVVTLHGCYHWGFNTGRNFNEATNFALNDWKNKFKVNYISVFNKIFVFDALDTVFQRPPMSEKGLNRFSRKI